MILLRSKIMIKKPFPFYHISNCLSIIVTKNEKNDKKNEKKSKNEKLHKKIWRYDKNSANTDAEFLSYHSIAPSFLSSIIIRRQQLVIRYVILIIIVVDKVHDTIVAVYREKLL